jgi:hypothetical protein
MGDLSQALEDRSLQQGEQSHQASAKSRKTVPFQSLSADAAKLSNALLVLKSPNTTDQDRKSRKKERSRDVVKQMACAIYRVPGIDPRIHPMVGDVGMGKSNWPIQIGDRQIVELTFPAASVDVQSLRNHVRRMATILGLVLDRYARV